MAQHRESLLHAQSRCQRLEDVADNALGDDADDTNDTNDANNLAENGRYWHAATSRKLRIKDECMHLFWLAAAEHASGH